MHFRTVFVVWICFFSTSIQEAVAQQPELILPVGHAFAISDVQFSPDGKLALTVGLTEAEKNIKIWESQSGKLLRTLNAHTAAITSVSFSPDGKYILSAGSDQHAKIWETASGSLYYDIHFSLTNWIKLGFFNNDGKQVLLVSDFGMELYDVNKKQLIRAIVDSALLTKDRTQPSASALLSCDFSDDGKYIVTAHLDSVIRIWETRSGRIIHQIKKEGIGFRYCSFNKMANRIVACAKDSIAWVIDVQTGQLIRKLAGHTHWIFSVTTSSNGKQALTASLDGSTKLWDIESGKLLQTYSDNRTPVIFTHFSGDGKWVMTRQADGKVKLWEKETGKFIRVITEPLFTMDYSKKEDAGYYISSIRAAFSNDSKYIISASLSNTATIQDIVTGKTMAKLEGLSTLNYKPSFSNDGKLLATCGAKDGSILAAGLDTRSKGNWMGRVWDTQSGKLLYNLEGHKGVVTEIQFSPNSQYIVTGSEDSTARIWEASSGKLLYNFDKHDGRIAKCYFTPDSRFLISQSFNSTGRIWNLETGKMISEIKHDSGSKEGNGIYFLYLSKTGHYFATAFYDSKTYITETATGKTIFRFDTRADSITMIILDPRDQFVYYCYKNNIYTKDIAGGNLVSTLKGHTSNIDYIALNSKGTMLASAGEDGIVNIWETVSGKIKTSIHTSGSRIFGISFSDNDEYLRTISYDSTIRMWEAATGKLLHTFKVVTSSFYTGKFTANNRFLVTQSYDNFLRVWDINSGKIISLIPFKYFDSFKLNPDESKVAVDNKFSVDLYNFGQSSPAFKIIPVGYNDYLEIDSAGRYDGTEGARKLLYLVCNNEVIELDQVKDLLWVPGLVERINKGEAINAKTINDLNICGLTPEIENKTAGDSYYFKITPRRGGLGETVLLVNGIEAGHYKPSQLNKNGTGYELNIKKEDLHNYFIAGKENQVTVKAYTADNAISSRGVKINEDKTKESGTPPNLYAVMVGVSDYKGDELDLKYAAKDATDISSAISNAAKKLLNTDGKDHVFMYNLTTAKEHYQLPEKNGIRKILEEIGKKANASDILLIFFAGHGVMSDRADAGRGGEKKQFYFLTADASKSSAASAVADVGISTTELTEWMKPQNIKAQKRILIFDACNSGQAINDFVKMGNSDQNYLAARNDDKAQQIKAIDKLNEKSGLFILSASSSNQSAYEMGRYSQGLLTYSLLKAIKQQPGILEDGKLLNVSRWFNAAEKTVSELAKETGARQEPQIVSNTNFNLGLVDEEVMAKIVLPNEKPLFARSNFHNAATKIDDLKLRSLVDKELNNISNRGIDATITYSPDYEGADAYSLSGDYNITGNAITVAVILIKGEVEKKQEYSINGTTDKLDELAAAIAARATEMVK